MPSKVYFTDLRSGPKSDLPGKVRRLFRAAGIADLISEGDFVALKLHWGEAGNLGYVPAPLIRPIAVECGAAGGRPFITDTLVSWRSTLSQALGFVPPPFQIASIV